MEASWRMKVSEDIVINNGEKMLDITLTRHGTIRARRLIILPQQG